MFFLGFKWAGRWLERMAIKPENVVARLEGMFRLPLAHAAREMVELFDEIFAIVGKHVPEVDLTPVRKELASLRNRANE